MRIHVIVIFVYIHTQESLMFRRPQLHAGVRAASSAAKSHRARAKANLSKSTEKQHKDWQSDEKVDDIKMCVLHIVFYV